MVPEDAKKALDQLDRHAFHGRLLHIIPARRQPGASGAEALGSARCLIISVLSHRFVLTVLLAFAFAFHGAWL